MSEIDDVVTRYWMAHYVDEGTGVCALCGNSGIVDTRLSAVSPKGQAVGAQTYCFCPNGQLMRRNDAPLDKSRPS